MNHLCIHDELAHDACNISAKVHQDGYVRPCHDGEPGCHHGVWNSSLPRPLQEHLLQVNHKPKLCSCSAEFEQLCVAIVLGKIDCYHLSATFTSSYQIRAILGVLDVWLDKTRNGEI